MNRSLRLRGQVQVQVVYGIDVSGGSIGGKRSEVGSARRWEVIQIRSGKMGIIVNGQKPGMDGGGRASWGMGNGGGHM